MYCFITFIIRTRTIKLVMWPTLQSPFMILCLIKLTNLWYFHASSWWSRLPNKTYATIFSLPSVHRPGEFLPALHCFVLIRHTYTCIGRQSYTLLKLFKSYLWHCFCQKIATIHQRYPTFRVLWPSSNTQNWNWREPQIISNVY